MGAVTELRSRAESGNDAAFRALLVVGSDDHDDYLTLGANAGRNVNKMVTDAQGIGGTIKVSEYANDQLHDLTLAAFNTRNAGLWKNVVEALEAGVMEETQLQKSVRFLAYRFQDLPSYVQRQLRRLAPKLEGSNFELWPANNEFAAAAVHLRIAAGTVPDFEVEALLLRLRATDPIGFVGTVASWHGEHKLPFLATMVVDTHPRVRGQAAFSLIEHAHRFPADQERALAVLRTVRTLDQGCYMADNLARSFSAFPSKALEPLVADLQNHQSALVRSRFVDDE